MLSYKRKLQRALIFFALSEILARSHISTKFILFAFVSIIFLLAHISFFFYPSFLTSHVPFCVFASCLFALVRPPSYLVQWHTLEAQDVLHWTFSVEGDLRNSPAKCQTKNIQLVLDYFMFKNTVLYSTLMRVKEKTASVPQKLIGRSHCSCKCHFTRHFSLFFFFALKTAFRVLCVKIPSKFCVI